MVSIPQSRIDSVISQIDGYIMERYIEAAKRIEAKEIEMALKYLTDAERLQALRTKVLSIPTTP